MSLGAGEPGSSPIQGCLRRTPRLYSLNLWRTPLCTWWFFHCMLVSRFVYKPVQAHWFVPQWTVPRPVFNLASQNSDPEATPRWLMLRYR